MIHTAIGIDPGRTGAIAAITCATKVPRVWDMPEHGKQRGIDLFAVDQILESIGSEASVVGLEWNTGRPGEVPDFAYRFGLQTGQLDALCWMRGLTVEHLASNKWTGRFGLPGKTWKGAVEQRAALWDRTYPPYRSLIRGPRGGLLDGRIDALLIAEYIRQGHANAAGLKSGRRPPVIRGTALGTSTLKDWWDNLSVPPLTPDQK